MRCGVLLVDKPAGLSSAQAVGAVRKRIGERRVGHAGTLDPAATGLLVCLIGPATRLAQYAEGGSKVYTGEFRFGVTTDTDDAAGEVLSKAAEIPDLSRIAELSARFIGRIEQVPPQVSALKVEGERAYKRARRGEDVVIAARTVTIEKFEVEPLPDGRAGYEVRCSKGTYIRSLARDLGELLGCGGIVETLRREVSEPFSVRDAVPLEEVTPEAILPWQNLFPDAPVVELEERHAARLSSGDQSALLELEGCGEPDGERAGSRIIYRAGGVPLGVIERFEGRWRIAANMPVDDLVGSRCRRSQS